MDGSCDASHESNVNSGKQQWDEKKTADGCQRRRTRGLKRATTTTCSNQARFDNDVEMSVDELAGYFDEQVHIPRKMSFMAELMYT